MSFIEKLKAAQTTRRSCVCVGLDPDPAKLPAHLGHDLESVRAFCYGLIDATADQVCTYKPNLAFFIALGGAGIDLLRDVIAHIPANVPTLLDAKFGDIGSTAERYAAFTFETLKADAVTVSPYVGTGAIQPFLAYPGKFAFVLSRTSNTEGNPFQPQRLEGGQPLFLEVATAMQTLSAEYPDQLGLVVGATQPGDVAAIRAAAPDLPFLVPGYGAQGGELGAILHDGTSHSGVQPVINVSRAVMYASSGEDYAAAARAKVQNIREEIERPRR
jgi:orotidine-5'-phosphate decarboxylase